MKSLIAVGLLAPMLAGCVAVPYYAEPAPAGYYYGPPAPAIHFRYDAHRHYRYDHRYRR